MAKSPFIVLATVTADLEICQIGDSMVKQGLAHAAGTLRHEVHSCRRIAVISRIENRTMAISIAKSRHSNDSNCG